MLNHIILRYEDAWLQFVETALEFSCFVLAVDLFGPDNSLQSLIELLVGFKTGCSAALSSGTCCTNYVNRVETLVQKVRA